MSTLSPESNGRYHDLDFVRSAAMLLGLVLHVCIMFMPPFQLFWGTGEYQGDELNLEFLSFIHLFRMQIFFLMAGFFAELVTDRKGFGFLVRDRVKRILLPFLVGVVLLMPIHTMLMKGSSGYYGNQLVGMDLWEQVRSLALFGLFDEHEGLEDGVIHFWFIFYLLVFYTLHFLLRPVFVRLGVRRIPGVESLLRHGLSNRWGPLALALLTMPLQYLIVDVFLPPSGFNAPLLDLVLYLVFYLFGMALYRQRELLPDLARNSWFLLLMALPFILFIGDATNRIDQSAPVIKDVTTWALFDMESLSYVGPVLHWEGLFHNGWNKVVIAFIRMALCWTMCLGFIGLAHRYLTRPRPLVRYLADSAYWVYWIHLTVTFKLSYMAQQWPWGSSLLRSYVTLVLSTVICFWSYNAFVRYTWLGDYFMGRRKSRTDPGEADLRMSVLLRKVAPGTLVGAGIALLLGQVLHFDRSFQGSPALVEAYVARDASTLADYPRLDDIVDRMGNGPLHAAAFRSEGQRLYDPVPTLLERTQDLDARNDFGRTALFVATRSGNRGDVERLLDAGANPNVADLYGHTPAHVAAIKTGVRGASASIHFAGILELLIEHGADPELRDVHGRDVAECLIDFGALAHHPPR